MKMSESIANLATAMNLFQAQVAGAKKSSNNPYYNSKYADLAEIWKTIREPLTANGLSILQPLDLSDPETVVVETLLLHKSGEWIMGSESVKPKKNDPQGMGSAITYARRYGLSAMLGIHQEDDDGNAAIAKKEISAKDLYKQINAAIGRLQGEMYDRWDQPARRKESCKAHLKTENVTDCKDVELLSKYLVHIKKAGARMLIGDMDKITADTYLAAINDCDSHDDIDKILASIKKEKESK